MKDKILDIFLQSVPILFASLLASIGGAVHYLNKIDRHGIPFRTFNFLLEIFTSGFVGIITFMLCDTAGWGWEFTAAIVAVSGHMGARALFIIERGIILPLLRRYGYDDSKTEIEPKEKAD